MITQRAVKASPLLGRGIWSNLAISLASSTIAIFCGLCFSLGAEPLPAPVSLDWGPSALGFAGATGTIVSDHDAFLTNPALLFYYESKGSIGGSWSETPGDRSQWSVSIIDGGTLPVVGGFHFGYANFGSSRRMTYTTAGAYKTPYGAVGVTAQVYNFSKITGPGGGWHFTGSTGIFAPLGDNGIALGAYSRSFFDFEKNSQMPPDIHLSALYTYPQLARMTFDADRRFVAPGQDWNYSAAADVLLKSSYALRAGYRWDHSHEQDFWSAGFAVLSPRMELVATFMRTTEGHHKNGLGFSGNYKF